MIVLFSGIVVFGIYLGACHNLRQLTAEAARASIGGVSDQERGTLARDRVESALAGGAMFKPGSVDVTVGHDPADPALYSVTLSFDARKLGVSSFAGLIPIPPDLIRSTINVRRGGL